MQAQQTIALIGDSILIEGIRLGLEDNPDLAIIHIAPANCEAVKIIKRHLPGLIIAELDDPWGECLLALLRAEPDMQLIGLEAGTGRISLLTGQHYVTQSLQDLLQFVRGLSVHSYHIPMSIGTE